MKEVYIIVPIYNPNRSITTAFIKELEKEFKNIVIINDGCKEEFNDYFKTFKKHTVLTHYVNQGKGRAIKTAFNYLLNSKDKFKGAVVADCDGQHTVEDIKNVAQQMIAKPDSLILGIRNFNEKNIPFRSRFGNKLTRTIFRLLTGLKVSDTQTGLRGYSIDLMPIFLKVDGERFEYETNMLLACKDQFIPISEVGIKTVYIEKNETSHFNPIKDSITIYKLLFKYIISSASSFFIDIFLFSMLLKLNLIIMHATIVARIISSMYNYYINQNVVFKKGTNSSVFKYYLLAVFQMSLSGFLVTRITNLITFAPTLIKIGVDSIIFLLSFVIQREWVFQNEKE